MQNLIKKEKNFIGARIKKCRRLLSLSQEQLASATGMSKGTLAKMEMGEGFTGDLLLNIVHFFSMNLSEFSDGNYTLPKEIEFRKKIHEYHKRHKSTQDKILNSEPSLTSILEFRLKNDYFQNARTVAEVIEFCKFEYHLSFKSSVVSQALINGVKEGWLKRSKTSGRNFTYQLKKK